MRTVDTQARKKDILLETIKQYMQSAVPVSSESIRQMYNLPLSSASIRNVLSELEDEGFLVQPHTSAGRIPTDKAYRYFLESLMQRESLDEEQKQEISSPLHFENISDLESILEKASDVLADLTHYTSIVSSLSRDDKFYFNGLHFLLELPEFNDIAKLRLFLSILEERKRILELINNAPQGSINIYIGKESHCDEIEECSLLVTTFSNKGSSHGHLGIIGPKRMNYSRVIAILEYLSQELSDLLSES